MDLLDLAGVTEPVEPPDPAAELKELFPATDAGLADLQRELRQCGGDVALLARTLGCGVRLLKSWVAVVAQAGGDQELADRVRRKRADGSTRAKRIEIQQLWSDDPAGALEWAACLMREHQSMAAAARHIGLTTEALTGLINVWRRMVSGAEVPGFPAA